ncbi:unnamed protein product [Arctia plantaginis]|uniref:lysozyme n=1 Tax=Arctia plantaginis TaxID=874455 RepID=A0A8S1B4V0_ARCPL|nr:unnamed protein product [Arctia plantaginis]
MLFLFVETSLRNIMNLHEIPAIPVCLWTLFVLWITCSGGVLLPNLSETCFLCLCHVSTGCDLTHDCTDGYCGPFNISRIYWYDAGQIVLPYDDPARNHAWKDCARNYECAKQIIANYLLKYGRDCNEDGTTDCYDYMMVNGNGGPSCSSSLHLSENGRAWLQRYDTQKNMNMKTTIAIPVCLFAVFIFWITGSSGVYIPNLTEACYKCLCYVSTGCDFSHDCTGGYCGPFNISRIYWKEAGQIVLPDDDPDRNHAWEDCAKSFHCAKRIIERYLEIFGRDCNGDGLTNCFDYMMINGNGGYGCTAPLNRSANGQRWLKRYEECRI